MLSRILPTFVSADNIGNSPVMGLWNLNNWRLTKKRYFFFINLHAVQAVNTYAIVNVQLPDSVLIVGDFQELLHVNIIICVIALLANSEENNCLPLQ